MLTATFASKSSNPARAIGEARLEISGRHFVDARGRTVILRGVNLAGDSKVPPFTPCAEPAGLDAVSDLGFNVIRLLFVWEAYEPSRGMYNDSYVKDLQKIVAAAGERGMRTIIDFHQDGFSRYTSRGAGDGFPSWAVSPRGRLSHPDNGSRCKNWALLMATDPTMHKSFADFFSDRHGVRTHYLAMVGRVAAAFARTPGVIGYDLLNEPWGHERAEIAPLYHDAARVIRAADPSAILFLQGHIATNCGVRTRLPRPESGPAAYAPHYYCPMTVAFRRWHGATAGINGAFTQMMKTARAWDTPLFLGEFGVGAGAARAGDYVTEIYDRLDACLASGTQWNYTPRWNPHTKDGWNDEDYSILDPSGAPRPNFRPRPYPRVTAGTPLRFRYEAGGSSSRSRWIEFAWNHEPDRGETEVFLPNSLFPAGSMIEVPTTGVTCRRDPARQVLICQADRAMTIPLKVITGPATSGRLAPSSGRSQRWLRALRGAG